MTFAVRLLPIDAVIDHPNADRLSIYTVRGYNCISAKSESGDHRFKVGERVIFVPENALLTEAQLKEQGFWAYNMELGREAGTLFGKGYNRVDTIQLRKRESTGLIWKQPDEFVDLPDNTDVAERLGITKYEPEIPAELLQVVTPVDAVRQTFDIARLRMYPNFFLGEEVAITEKLEGENVQLTWMGDQRAEGVHSDGQIAISTKGLAEKRLAFLDTPGAASIPVLQAINASGLIDKLADLAHSVGTHRTIKIIAEAIGPGIKKLHYGYCAPFARAFDIRIDGVWLGEDEKAMSFKKHNIERAPLLCRGPFNPETVEELRQGNTTIAGGHIREGIVIAAVGSQVKRETELGDEIRPVLKAHSDVFLRKFSH